MKKAAFLVLLVPVLLLSCLPSKNDGGTMCTEIYMSIIINVRDSVGKPYVLDFYSVKVVSTDQTLPFRYDSLAAVEGRYTLATDSDIKYISQRGSTLLFTGYVKDKAIVTGNYVVTQDECHVYLVSGDETLVVK